MKFFLQFMFIRVGDKIRFVSDQLRCYPLRGGATGSRIRPLDTALSVVKLFYCFSALLVRAHDKANLINLCRNVCRLPTILAQNVGQNVIAADRDAEFQYHNSAACILCKERNAIAHAQITVTVETDSCLQARVSESCTKQFL